VADVESFCQQFLPLVTEHTLLDTALRLHVPRGLARRF
jgi:hypothetical protein